MLTTLFILFSCSVFFNVGAVPTCDGPHEYLKCVQSCPPQPTCQIRDPGRNYACLAVITPCESMCVCESGYFRNSDNQCVTAEDCNKCDSGNEYFACGDPCDNVCGLKYGNKTHCPIKYFDECTPRCYCEDGYARSGKKQRCIPIEDCPK